MSLTLFLFIVSLLIGLIIVFPLTPKFFPEEKKVAYTLGVILAHTGLYGILWIVVPHFILISILLFELGILMLWDPLGWFPPQHKKNMHLISYVLIVAGLVTGISFAELFPLWLWILPIAIYLMPQLVKPWRQHNRLFVAASISISVAYCILIGFKIHKYFQDDISDAQPLPSVELALPLPPVLEPPVELPMAPPVEPSAPDLTAEVHEIDSTLKSLKEQNVNLGHEVKRLAEENERLGAEVLQLKKKINSIQEILIP